VLALACAASLAAVASGSASAARQRVVGASDAAALAAADASTGLVPGEPCAVAARVAAANGASLAGCSIDGATATVEVAAAVLGSTARARSTAGPPPAAPGGAGAP
jgi:secretion/DNA translocation related TadE-like protein